MRRHHKFTLVELLVSLGIFSILLVLFMQFFSGMRLAWTNTEKRSDSHYSVRIVMDMLASLMSNMYYTNAGTDEFDKMVQFPFMVKRSGNDSSKPAALYFASKANLDLPGSNPVRFIGIHYANPVNNDFKFGLSDERKELHALYLTSISNADKDGGDNDITSKNKNIYHRFWPAPAFLDSSDQVTDAKGALEYLVKTLDEKVKPAATGAVESFKLLDRVTEFKVRLFNADGSEIDNSVAESSRMPHSVELIISVMAENDFEAWIAGGKNDEFKREKQMTFTRRVYIGDRWNMEDKYDEY